MEQNQNTSLFGMNVDQSGKYHLTEATKWAKFLAIFGIIVCLLIALIGVFFGAFFESLMSGRGGREFAEFNEFQELTRATTRQASIGFALVYVLIALLYFFPCLFLYKFAVRARRALDINDSNLLTTSFQSLKATFRYLGVITIIIITFWVLAFVVGIIAGNSM